MSEKNPKSMSNVNKLLKSCLIIKEQRGRSARFIFVTCGKSLNNPISVNTICSGHDFV
jgi:hypothetical protein